MLNVKIKDNSKKVRNAIKKLGNKVKPSIHKTLSYVSAFEISQIINRTQKKGIDVNENPFKPYSIGYKRAKVKESGVVDLKDSGQMFSSLTSKITPSKGSLFFRQKSANDKAFYHDTGIGKMPKREFFSISNKEQDKIEKLFFDRMASELGLWVLEKI